MSEKNSWTCILIIHSKVWWRQERLLMRHSWSKVIFFSTKPSFSNLTIYILDSVTYIPDKDLSSWSSTVAMEWWAKPTHSTTAATTTTTSSAKTKSIAQHSQSTQSSQGVSGRGITHTTRTSSPSTKTTTRSQTTAAQCTKITGQLCQGTQTLKTLKQLKNCHGVHVVSSPSSSSSTTQVCIVHTQVTQLLHNGCIAILEGKKMDFHSVVAVRKVLKYQFENDF